MKQCLTNLNEFASQKTGHCDYIPIREALENYKNCNSEYISAKNIGIKAICSGQLTKNSVERAEFIIENNDKVLKEFKEIIDKDRSTY